MLTFSFPRIGTGPRHGTSRRLQVYSTVSTSWQSIWDFMPSCLAHSKSKLPAVRMVRLNVDMLSRLRFKSSGYRLEEVVSPPARSFQSTENSNLMPFDITRDHNRLKAVGSHILSATYLFAKLHLVIDGIEEVFRNAEKLQGCPIAAPWRPLSMAAEKKSF